MNKYYVEIGGYYWKDIKASSLRVAINRAYKSFEKHHDGKKKTTITVYAYLLEKDI